MSLTWLVALASVVVLAAGFGSGASVAAQERTSPADALPTPAPEQGIDLCLVALSVEGRELRIGETMRLWIWGLGVEPSGWNLEVDGTGSVALRGAREINTVAELVEWTVVGEREGEVTLSVGMVCEKPGDGTDSLTLTVLPAVPESLPNPTPQPSADFCVAHLSVSEREVAMGDVFYAWFVGAGTEPRSWNLTLDGEGSARIVGTRELDPEYVEWQLEAVDVGTVRLIGAMSCVQPGEGFSTSEIVITQPEGGTLGQRGTMDQTGVATPGVATPGNGSTGAPSTMVTIQAVLMTVLLATLVVLTYLVRRRR